MYLSNCAVREGSSSLLTVTPLRVMSFATQSITRPAIQEPR